MQVWGQTQWPVQGVEEACFPSQNIKGNRTKNKVDSKEEEWADDPLFFFYCHKSFGLCAPSPPPPSQGTLDLPLKLNGRYLQMVDDRHWSRSDFLIHGCCLREIDWFILWSEHTPKTKDIAILPISIHLLVIVTTYGFGTWSQQRHAGIHSTPCLSPTFNILVRLYTP